MANGGVKRGMGMTSPFPNLPGSPGQYLLKAPGRPGGISYGSLPIVDGTAEFGIDVLGCVADNSTRINNAILAGQKGGYLIFLPPQPNGSPGITLIQNPLIIGNGSATALSTVFGGGLIGTGAPMLNTGSTVQGASSILWNGAAGASYMAQVAGPHQGAVLQNLILDGGATVGSQPVRALQLLSSQFGRFVDLLTRDTPCGVHLYGQTVSSPLIAGQGNTTRNFFHRVVVNLPDTTAGITLSQVNPSTGNAGTANTGIVHSGGTNSNSCYNYLLQCEVHSASGANPYYSIVLASCDNETYERIQAHNVLYFFNDQANANHPVDCEIRVIDFGSSAADAGAHFLGGSAIAGSNNRIIGIATTNSFPTNPNVLGLSWIHEVGASPGSILASLSYNPAGNNAYSTTSATAVQIDSTNLPITIVMPWSGQIWVECNAPVHTSVAGDSVGFGVFVNGSLQTGTVQAWNNSTVQSVRATAKALVTGTPGTSYIISPAWLVGGGGTATIGYGAGTSNNGPVNVIITAA